MLNEVKSFVINRSEWLPREAQRLGGESFLLHPENGRMCCLGLYLRECGISASTLIGRKMPHNISSQAKLPDWMLGYHDGNSSDTALKLAKLNDAVDDFEEMPLGEREALIVEVFASLGIEVRFKGALKPHR
jgi:hypothetical protein